MYFSCVFSPFFDISLRISFYAARQSHNHDKNNEVGWAFLDPHAWFAAFILPRVLKVEYAFGRAIGVDLSYSVSFLGILDQAPWWAWVSLRSLSMVRLCNVDWWMLILCYSRIHVPTFRPYMTLRRLLMLCYICLKETNKENQILRKIELVRWTWSDCARIQKLFVSHVE